MSADSNAMIQALLAQRFANPANAQQQQSAAPGNPSPQMAGPVNPAAASQIAQKLMLMRALQQRPPGIPQPTPQTPAAGVQLGWNSGNGLPAP